MEKLLQQPVQGNQRVALRAFRVLLLALCLPTSDLLAASFTATLDRDTITAGDTATLTLKFEGGEPKNIPAPSSSPNLQITSQGTSQNFTMVNGATTISKSESYGLTPTQPGEYVIPAMRCEIDGRIFTSQPLRLRATKPVPAPTDIAEASSQLAFMRLVLPKQEACVGEPLVVTLELYFQNGVQNFGNFQITSQPAEGFNVGAKMQGQNHRAQIGNTSWTVVPLMTFSTK